MSFTKISTLIVVSLLMISCSDKKKQSQDETATEKNQHNNHVYYLSIGNAHYKKDQSTESFGNVQGANTSADMVADNLSVYGSGLKLKSSKAQPLTKEVINKYLDSIVSIAVKDSLSTTFIYYCGHGFSDKAGNIFMVPGNHQFNEQKANSMESLVSVNEIQKKIGDAIAKQYPTKKLSKKDGEELATIINPDINNSNNNDTPIDPNKYMQVVNEYTRAKIAKFHVPRFIIMADCCTDGFNVVNYKMMESMNDKISDDFKLAEKKIQQQFKNMGEAGTYALKNFRKTFKDLRTVGPMLILKGQMFMGGTRTVYTGELGKPAEMTPSPKDPNLTVGPICRRLALFFDKNHEKFQVAGLLSSLYEKDFDMASSTAKFEMPDGKWFSANPTSGMITKFKPSLGDNPYLDKRDSIVYVANR